MSGIELHKAGQQELDEVKAKLEDLKTRFGLKEPNRGDLTDEEIQWRTGRPDYTRANYQYLKGKTQNHEVGSLEELVENLVKTWECQQHCRQHSLLFTQFVRLLS
jgi:hypothetical protein